MSIFAKTYTQGNYYPKHPEKCLNTNGKLGNKPAITYRSSWELKFMRFCDKYESVLEWGSEVLKIPYISEVDTTPVTIGECSVSLNIDRKGKLSLNIGNLLFFGKKKKHQRTK